MKLPSHIEQAVRSFQKIQGVGRKTAERYVFDMMTHWKSSSIQEFSQAIGQLVEHVSRCTLCRAPSQTENQCVFCTKERLKNPLIAIVGSLRDLYSMEVLQIFQGTYFLLDALLSPLDKRGISEMVLEALFRRIENEKIEEIFLALDSSPEGEATALYLVDSIQKRVGSTNPQLKITGFATGLPMGSSFEYLDMTTLTRAFSSRVVKLSA